MVLKTDQILFYSRFYKAIPYGKKINKYHKYEDDKIIKVSEIMDLYFKEFEKKPSSIMIQKHIKEKVINGTQIIEILYKPEIKKNKKIKIL